MSGEEDKGSTILRRTLSAISWLYALWNVLLWAMATGLRAKPALDPRLLLFHGAVLGLAGTLLWKPRDGAGLSTLLAAGGSIAAVVFDLRSHSPEAAAIDGAYVLVAAALYFKSRA
jgi:hypothetical protein